MSTSEARIRSNQANSLKSTGPKTPEGKAISRANSFKHGMTGAGVVLPNEDIREVEQRFESYRNDLQPVGEVAETLVHRAAFLSVRLDRCVSHETASLRGLIRRAEADFVAPAGLDANEVAQLRAEAKARAMFDSSQEATLARRYEAAAERGFFRALKELRLLEKQAQAVEPNLSAREFEEMLASSERFDRQADAFEARYLAGDLQSPSMPSRRPEPAPYTPVGGSFEVPIAIGRRP